MPDIKSSQHPSPNYPPLRPAVVDLAANADPASALHDALCAWGFVAVRNTAVSAELRERAFASARAYFAQGDSIKQRDAYRDTEANFGYQGLGCEALDPNQASDQADLKEAFTMRSLSSRSQPSETNEKNSRASVQSEWAGSEFGQTAIELYLACSETALHLLELIATELGADSQTFAQHHTGENMTLRYLHYPQLTKTTTTSERDLSTSAVHSSGVKKFGNEKKMPQLGAGAHTDYGTITLLFSDGVAGLQLYDVFDTDGGEDHRGGWRDVVVEPGDALLNTGDLMSLWSNGLYPSTLHRVQPRYEKPDRFSMAFFVDPDSSTRVSPLPSCINADKSGAHPITANAVVAGEHIQARIEASQRTLA